MQNQLFCNYFFDAIEHIIISEADFCVAQLFLFFFNASLGIVGVVSFQIDTLYIYYIHICTILSKLVQ